jgi:hypothetical protein
MPLNKEVNTIGKFIPYLLGAIAALWTYDKYISRDNTMFFKKQLDKKDLIIEQKDDEENRYFIYKSKIDTKVEIDSTLKQLSK